MVHYSEWLIVTSGLGVLLVRAQNALGVRLAIERNGTD